MNHNQLTMNKNPKDYEVIGHRVQGLGLIGAVTFILGDIAGSGILALPDSIKGTGWTGLGLIVLCSVLATYSGIFLARSWLILEERWPEYQLPNRTPFATIAYRACGPAVSRLASAMMNMQLFGASVVFMLLTAELMQSILRPWLQLAFCDWIIIAGLLLMPFTYFGSPADFWLVGVTGATGTIVSVILIVYLSCTEIDTQVPVAFVTPTFRSYLLSVGTLMFGVSGACALPTFQNDMKDKSKFSMACVISFTIMCIAYFSVSFTGYLAFGLNIQSNIIRNLPDNWITSTISVFMAGHVFCAYLILLNPVNLSFEDSLGLPHSFNWKRTGFRTLVTLISMLIGLSVPRFGKVLNFIGASASTANTFLFPPIFYILLCRQQNGSWPLRAISKSTWVLSAIMITMGVVTAVSGTFFAFLEIVEPNAFTLPCYIDKCQSELPVFMSNATIVSCST
ncbi:Proton-coupled amino acid transporter 1 [Halotydeus destructor]|nr:Proton-coupled amino acid transporter 1 [Halotydeus destructor]